MTEPTPTMPVVGAKCGKCGTDIPEGDQYCAVCGALPLFHAQKRQPPNPTEQ